jgi:hypothetical protein
MSFCSAQQLLRPVSPATECKYVSPNLFATVLDVWWPALHHRRTHDLLVEKSMHARNMGGSSPAGEEAGSIPIHTAGFASSDTSLSISHPARIYDTSTEILQIRRLKQLHKKLLKWHDSKGRPASPITRTGVTTSFDQRNPPRLVGIIGFTRHGNALGAWSSSVTLFSASFLEGSPSAVARLGVA